MSDAVRRARGADLGAVRHGRPRAGRAGRRRGYRPDLIFSIARGGLFVAGALGYALDVKNLYWRTSSSTPASTSACRCRSCSRRCRTWSTWRAHRADPDDVADTGATLRLVHDFCNEPLAEVRCAVVYEKPRTVECEYVWRRTDRWINFPWSTQPPSPGAASATPTF